jgi:hypothetical protein
MLFEEKGGSHLAEPAEQAPEVREDVTVHLIVFVMMVLVMLMMMMI